MLMNSGSVRRIGVSLFATATVLGVTFLASEAATTNTTKTTKSTKVAAKKSTAKRTTPKRVTPTAKRAATTVKSTTTHPPTTTVSPATARVLAGYENYFTAFVAAAREPERADQLLPLGMTGDALARMLEIRRLDAAEGVYWDGTRKDIVSGPRIEAIGESTATLRDCRSVGGVLRRKASGEVVAGTTEPDIDDMRVTFVLIADKWVVSATERFNDVEGRSRCVPGSPPS
jgi:hypothetical protein